jgi:restriction endonuclease S subunit
MKLGEIAKISIGVLLNREGDKEGKLRYKLFNLKNYEEKDEYEDFFTNKNLDEKLTKEGDILFRLVSPNKVVFIEKEQENLLVPSQLCIIRVDKNLVNPIFLKWYFENDLGQEKIMLELRGSSIQKISVNALRNIEIPEIDLKKQNEIEDLIKLWNQEKEVLQLLIENKDELYNNIIEEIIEGGN